MTAWSLVPTAWLLAEGASWLLTAARAFGLAWTAPAWSTPALGARLRLGLALMLAVVIGPVLAPAGRPIGLAVPDGNDPTVVLAWIRLAGCGIVELLVGAGLGLATGLILAGARQAGELVGIQAGLTPAAVFDPDSLADGGLTPAGHLYGLVALVLFLALDGPLTLVDTLAESYQVVPVGGGLIDPKGPAVATDAPVSPPAAAVRWVFARVGRATELAARIAAPVAVALMLAGLAVALILRSTPASPVAGLAWPLRSMLGLALVWLGMAALVATLGGVWADWARRIFAA